MFLVGCNLFTSLDGSNSTQPVEDIVAPPQASGESTSSSQIDTQSSPTDVPTEIPTETPPPTSTLITSVNAFPDPESFVANVFVRGLDRPLFLTHAGDGSGRLFVVEKPGRIIILQAGSRFNRQQRWV